GENRRVGERSALLVDRRRRFEFFKVPRSGREAERRRFRLGVGERPGEERELPDAEAVRLAGGDRTGAPQRTRTIARATDADEQDALNSPLSTREMQRFVASATEVAASDHAPDRAPDRRISRGQRVTHGRRARKGDDKQRRVERPEIWRGSVEG